MPKRKAKWQNDYIARNYDRINFLVPKGEKSIIQAAAAASGESTNAFLRRVALAEADRLGVTTPPLMSEDEFADFSEEPKE